MRTPSEDAGRNLYLGISDQIFNSLKIKYFCSVEGNIITFETAFLHYSTFSGLCISCYHNGGFHNFCSSWIDKEKGPGIFRA